MSQTRIMSIHRLLMRLFPTFCLGKALNGNVKHFVFDLTCDVTGDLEVKFLNFRKINFVFFRKKYVEWFNNRDFRVLRRNWTVKHVSHD